MLFSCLLMCDPSVTLALDYKIQYVRCFKVSFGVEGRHGGGGEYKLLSQHQSSLLTFAKISSFHHHGDENALASASQFYVCLRLL